MSEKKKVFYLYSKDPSKMKDGGSNPIPKKLRQRRQVLAGVVVGGYLKIGKSECSHQDVFRKITGRNKATGLALSSPLQVIAITEGCDVGKMFVEAALSLITPAPVVESVTKVTYRKVR